jgi:hypothetical protein
LKIHNSFDFYKVCTWIEHSSFFIFIFFLIHVKCLFSI